MRRIASLMVMVAVGFAVTGCKSKEQVEAEKNAVKAEQDKLQGKWKVASRSGESEDEEVTPSSYYVIEGDILKLVFLDKEGKEEVLHRQKMTITPGKEPKQVDLTYVDESGKEITTTERTKSLRGKKKTKKTTLKDAAIYKVDGDKLQICISYDEKNRPTDFTAPAGSSRYLLNLEKMKEGEKISATPADETKADDKKEKEKADGKTKEQPADKAKDKASDTKDKAKDKN